MTGWVRSSHCAAGDCVEVCRDDLGRVLIRRDPDMLAVEPAEWDAFTAGIKDGDFDQLGDTP